MTKRTTYRQPDRPATNTCVKAAKWVPVLFVIAIIVWSYYAYVIQLCIFMVREELKKALYLGFFHFFFLMLIWAYCYTVSMKNGIIPSQFKLPESEYDRLIHANSEDMQKYILEMFCHDLPNLNRTLNGTVRYCDKCRQIKPDRSHHCSVCGECVLKMDHHCPWVNNCVSFTNYKFFMLFLIYSLMYSLYIMGTSAEFFVVYWKGDLEGPGKFHVVFLFFVACMFAISLLSLFGYHCYLVLHNRTTLEAFAAPIFAGGPRKNAYDLGKMNNIREVFGNDWKLWLVPVSTTLGNGYTFSLNSRRKDEEQGLLNDYTG